MRVKYTVTVSEAEKFLSDYYVNTMAADLADELEIDTNVEVSIIPDSPNTDFGLDLCNEDCCKDDGMENYLRSKTERKDWDDDILNSSQFEHRDTDEVTYEETCVCDANKGNPCDECQRVIQVYIDNKFEVRERQSFYDNRNDGTGWGTNTNDDMWPDEFQRVRLKAGRNKYFIIDRESDTILATATYIAQARRVGFKYQGMADKEYDHAVEMTRYDRHEN